MVLRRFSVTAMLKWSHWISTLNNRKGADDLPHCELAMVFVHSLDFYLSEFFITFSYLFLRCLWYYHNLPPCLHHVYMFPSFFRSSPADKIEVNASGLWMHPHGASGRERSVVQRFHRILILIWIDRYIVTIRSISNPQKRY